ncbi:hypothetical protein [Desulfosporosinus sp. SB140]|uniref:hypothetical protein n=1 Tax=Desulfosporosinus paludis TaxID=3115649 RepID=UPI00388D380A
MNNNSGDIKGKGNRKKIIIISEYYAPENIIAAVRMSKITKYLNKDGKYEILVIANEYNKDYEDEILKKDVIDKANIVRIDNNRIGRFVYCLLVNRHNRRIKMNSADSQHNSVLRNNNQIKVQFKLLAYYLIEYANTMAFKHGAIRYLRTVDLSDYSYIISTYGPLSSHLVAKWIKKLYPSIRWIADFRDPVLNIFTPLGFRHYARIYAQRVTKSADAVVAVSKGCMNELFLENYPNKHIITNGYDREDVTDILATNNTYHDKLIFAYVGSLYEGKRDLTAVFRCIRELINEELMEIDKVSFVYAGASEACFLQQIGKYNLENNTTVCGVISREQSLEVQRHADILLLASWNNVGSTGVITGKFFEYIMMDRPILCAISGNLPNCTLKEMIHEAKIGVCYEEVNDEVDYQLLKQFILTKYNEFTDSGKLAFNPNYDYIERFNYKNIVKQFEDLF